MQVKQFSEISDPETWDLSQNEDIIITKKILNDQRVLVSYENYKKLKNALKQSKQNELKARDAEEFDLNPFLDELNTIVKNGHFEDITDQPDYFEKMARRVKSID